MYEIVFIAFLIDVTNLNKISIFTFDFLKKEPMKNYQLIFFALFVPITILGQSIHTGNWGIHDYYYDFVPDTNILQPENNMINSVVIDMNGDGVDDIQLSTIYSYMSAWFSEQKVIIDGLNQSQIAYSGIDSCFSNDSIPIFVYTNFVPLELNYDEIIDNTSNWTDSTVCLSFHEWNAAYPSNMGFGCWRESAFQNNMGYFAVRVLNSNDTLYGWIRVSNVEYSSCKVQEYACNFELTAIGERGLNSGINIYPNPSSGIVFINVENQSQRINNIKVYNSVMLVKEVQVRDKDNLRFDLSYLPNGLYFISIEMSNGTKITRKIILTKN